MNPILLTKDQDRVDLPRDASALWLYHDRAPVPCADRAISLSRFLDDPFGVTRNTELLIVCGLVSRITTPSNRVRLGQFLTEPWRGPKRISVDDRLFTVDPWRLWWHFGCVGAAYNGYHTSYRLESSWNNYLMGREPNPCSEDLVSEYGAGVVSALNPFRFSSVNITVEAMSPARQEAYQAEKELAFQQETSIAAIIARLSRFAAHEYPFRCIPSYRALFEQEAVTVRATDFGVDRFLVNGIRQRVELTNFIAREFSC